VAACAVNGLIPSPPMLILAKVGSTGALLAEVVGGATEGLAGYSATATGAVDLEVAEVAAEILVGVRLEVEV